VSYGEISAAQTEVDLAGITTWTARRESLSGLLGNAVQIERVRCTLSSQQSWWTDESWATPHERRDKSGIVLARVNAPGRRATCVRSTPAIHITLRVISPILTPRITSSQRTKITGVKVSALSSLGEIAFRISLNFHLNRWQTALRTRGSSLLRRTKHDCLVKHFFRMLYNSGIPRIDSSISPICPTKWMLDRIT
jgi:hypothetical protein